MSPRPAPYSTFNSTEGEPQTKDSPLTPFWDKSGDRFWTSDQIKDSTTTFGYAYPETQEWKYTDEGAYQAAIRQAVTELYGTNVFDNFVRANLQNRAKEHAVAIKALTAAKQDFAEDAAAARSEAIEQREPARFVNSNRSSGIPDSLKHLAPDNKYTEWVVNIRAQKHGLGQAFRVQVFLGDIDESDPDSWDTEFNAVGRVSVLGRSRETQCAKCRIDTASGLMVSGTVPLTSALLQDIIGGEVASLQPEDVVPYLTKNLRWKTRLLESGDEKECEQVPGLKVSVASTEVTIGEDGLPEYSGQYVVYPEITDGKPGGLCAGEHL